MMKEEKNKLAMPIVIGLIFVLFGWVAYTIWEMEVTKDTDQYTLCVNCKEAKTKAASQTQ